MQHAAASMRGGGLIQTTSMHMSPNMHTMAAVVQATTERATAAPCRCAQAISQSRALCHMGYWCDGAVFDTLRHRPPHWSPELLMARGRTKGQLAPCLRASPQGSSLQLQQHPQLHLQTESPSTKVTREAGSPGWAPHCSWPGTGPQRRVARTQRRAYAWLRYRWSWARA